MDAGHARTAVAAAAKDPDVVSLSLDSRVSAAAITSAASTGPATPATPDPGRSQQWALDALGAETAWSRHDAGGVTVAVVDSGVQASHPDLAGAMLPGTDFVTAGGDGSADGSGHGTHVAGIIAAIAGNGIGVEGLAPGAKILPVRVLGDDGSGWSSNIAKGIVYAADKGAGVISLSLGGASADPAMQTAISYARGKGALVVAAAGNSRASGNPVNYPAAFPGVLAVAATDRAGAGAPFSNTGSYVGIAAPGVDILSTFKGSTWTFLSGTSMATPYVSAAAALLKSARPALTGDQLATALTSTATDRGAPGKDVEFGAGIVNPVAALCSLGLCGTGTPSPTPSVTPSPSTTPKPSGTPTPVTSSSLQLRSMPSGAVFGSTVTVTAALTSAGKAIPSAPVTVCTRGGTSSYACVGYAGDASGVVTARIQVIGNQVVKVAYAGSGVAGPATVEAPLAALSSLGVVGSKGGITATVSPLLGQGVLVEKLSGGRWIALAGATLPNAGATARSTVSVRRLAAGTYRFTVQATSTLTSTVSPAVSVT